MTRLMKSKKGASSILVILLLVVLVVFGVAALTTALSNVRLGQKVVDWNEKYYAAEAQANEVYAQIDSAVRTAWSTPLCMTEEAENIIAGSVNQLDFEVNAGINEDTIDFTYVTWEDDVGVQVVLTYQKSFGELEVTQWKAVQK